MFCIELNLLNFRVLMIEMRGISGGGNLNSFKFFFLRIISVRSHIGWR